MELNKFQGLFLDCVIKEENNEEIIQDMIPIGDLTPAQVLDVYRGDYFSRLTEALGELYEACWYVLGDDDFHELAKTFILNNNSTNPSLANYGDAFSKFLKDTLDEDFAFVSDLASFELMFWKLFHKGDYTPKFKPEDIDQANLLELEFTFSSHLKLFSSSHQILKIWEIKNDQNSDHNLSLDDIGVRQNIVLYKFSDRVIYNELPLPLFNLFKNLIKGENFGQAASEISGLEELAPNDWQLLFTTISNTRIS